MIEKNTGAKIIWHFLEISNMLNKYGDYISQVEGLTTQQWLIMLYLAGDPNIPFFDREKHAKPLMASELAEAFNVSRPNITNLLNNLLKKEMIVQVEDEADRRKKRLRLSEKGQKLLAKLEPGRKKFNDNLLAHFTTLEKDRLLQYLDSCNNTIRAHFTETAVKQP